jgi:hypothetical protein
MDYEETYVAGYTYVAMNPPFGSSTVITENTVLEKFILGREEKNKSGYYFGVGDEVAERKRVLFIIPPSGYIGNKNKTYTELRKFILV